MNRTDASRKDNNCREPEPEKNPSQFDNGGGSFEWSPSQKRCFRNSAALGTDTKQKLLREVGSNGGIPRSDTTNSRNKSTRFCAFPSESQSQEEYTDLDLDAT